MVTFSKILVKLSKKNSILVQIFENFKNVDFSKIFVKFRFWSKFFEKFRFFRKFRKISILLKFSKIFRFWLKFFQNLRFIGNFEKFRSWSNFRKNSVLVKISKNFDFGQIFEKFRLWSKFRKFWSNYRKKFRF